MITVEKEQKKNIVICIPTYNRPEVTRELLETYIDLWASLNIDVIVFDSSEDDRTKQVCAQYFGRDILKYEHVDSDVHSNIKVFRMYQSKELCSKYNYIWLMADHVRWSEVITKRVCEKVKGDYDFIVLSNNTRIIEKDTDLHDKQEFWQVLGWYITLYGACLVNTNTVLKDVDWKYMYEKYINEDCINFSHMGLYFEQTLKLETLSVSYLVNDNGFYTSALRNGSGWKKEPFKLWCDIWVKSVYALPDFYLNKREVLKAQSTKGKMLNLQYMIGYRMNGVYSIADFFRYFTKWRYCSEVSMFRLLMLAIKPKWLMCAKFIDKSWFMQRKLGHFCAKYSDTYIYGAGRYGIRLVEVMNKNNIPFKGFVVSSIDENKQEVLGYPVIEYSEEIFNDKKVGIIIALNKKNRECVIGEKKLVKYKHRVFEKINFSGF